MSVCQVTWRSISHPACRFVCCCASWRKASAKSAGRWTRQVHVPNLILYFASSRILNKSTPLQMMAETDAREMYQQFYRDSPQIDFFVGVLTGRSREQLRETFRTFRRFAGIDVLTALEPLFTAEFAEAMRLLGKPYSYCRIADFDEMIQFLLYF